MPGKETKKKLFKRSKKMFSGLTTDFASKFTSLGLGGGSTAASKEAQLENMSKEDAECYGEWGVTLAEEKVLLEQLREEILLDAQLGPEWDDVALRRYLRARKHDIAKAKEMVLKTLEWRAEVGADSIFEDFEFHEKEQFHKHYPEGFYNVDKEGRPVYVQQPGNIDTNELWKFTTLDRSIKYHISQQEKYVRRIAPAATIAAGKPRYQSLVLIDMEGVGVGTVTGEVRKIMGTVMSIDQDYYPELMYKALIINAPTSFRIIWSMVKYLLDSRTQSKIEVLPVDYEKVLFEYIAPEKLLPKYGGKCTEKLIDEPGPWKDPKILNEILEKEKEHAEQRRMKQQN